MLDIEEAVHPVRLTFNNISSEYRLSVANRVSTICFVKELMDDNLDESFELIEVDYADRDGNRSLLPSMLHHGRRLNALSLPLCVTVKRSANQSDFSLSYVVEVLEDHKQDIVRKLRFLNWDSFKNVGLSIATYNSADIATEPIPGIKEMETTVHPMQMTFENVPAGYRLSTADWMSNICF